MSTLNATQSDVQVSSQDARGVLLRRISLLLAVAGILITGYMTYNKLSGQVLPCTNEGIVNCSVVENSAWAYVLGVPTATWGLLAHLAIAAILLLDQRVAFLREYSVIILFGIVLFGMLYHTYLIYVSLTILRAICPWCMAAATIMLLQLIVTGIRLRRTLAA